MRRRFYWPGQRRDIERWCAACETCAIRKAPPTKPRAAMQADLPSGPFERVAMDILGPLPITTRGNKYILVVGDYFTKWVESFPLASIEAEKVVEVFVLSLSVVLVPQISFIQIKAEILILLLLKPCANCWALRKRELQLTIHSLMV